MATGGGGYEVVDVVPRAWLIWWPSPPTVRSSRPTTSRSPGGTTCRLAAVARRGPDDRRWGIERRSWSTGYDPADPVDRAVMATRKVVYPLHGLDPWFD